MIRKYSELCTLNSFEERFEYLKLVGEIGQETFGFDRYINQTYYRSKEWRSLRNKIIVRDLGLEMGLKDYPINGRIIVHHMNPIRQDDILNQTQLALEPEYLICVSHQVHNAIHYGDPKLIPTSTINTRFPNDTCPWK